MTTTTNDKESTFSIKRQATTPWCTVTAKPGSERRFVSHVNVRPLKCERYVNTSWRHCPRTLSQKPHTHLREGAPHHTAAATKPAHQPLPPPKPSSHSHEMVRRHNDDDDDEEDDDDDDDDDNDNDNESRPAVTAVIATHALAQRYTTTDTIKRQKQHTDTAPPQLQACQTHHSTWSSLSPRCIRGHMAIWAASTRRAPPASAIGQSLHSYCSVRPCKRCFKRGEQP
jgi:hypothetical protein